MHSERKIIIVGGVAAGMSAATRLRRLDETAQIVVFERGEHVSFANCGLPYYVGGVIEDRSALLLQTPAGLGDRFRLDVRTRTEVISIDRAAKRVIVRDVETGLETAESYDSLVLAGGATTTGVLDGADIPSHTLRTVDDVDHIVAGIESLSGTPRAVVVGGGFIGLEATENLVRRGISVVLVQRGEHVLSPLDPELSALLREELIANGVDVRAGTALNGVENGAAILSDGSVLPTDFIIDATGVHPDAALARESGLRIGATGGVWVDEFQRTSDPSIYAAGDGTEKVDAVDGAATLVTMAGLANRHGRAVADAIAGTPAPAAPALGTAVVGLFGLTAAMVGWSETRLRKAGRPHRVIHTHPADHAAYYPGAETMHAKLLVDPDTDLILGAQIVGGAGVDKRIDILAVAMSAGITASALSGLELAYAPQYGSAKDPINQLGYVADNLARGATRTIQWHELDTELNLGVLLVDVRTAAEFAAGSIPAAINIPVDELRARLAELSGADVIVHCQVGQRGHTAARLLAQHGITVRNLDGGYLTWRAGASTHSTVKDPA